MEKELIERLNRIVACLSATGEAKVDPKSEGSYWMRSYELWGLRLMLKPESGNKVSAHLCCPFEWNEHWPRATGDRRLTTTLSLTKTDERIAADIYRTLAANARDIRPVLQELVADKKTYVDAKQARMQAGVEAGAKACKQWKSYNSDIIDSITVHGEASHLDALCDDDRVTVNAKTPEQLATLVRLVRAWNRGEKVTIKSE